MTIDEAIKFEKSGKYPISKMYHEQIAEWLEELKDLRKWKDQEEKACDRFYKKGEEAALNTLNMLDKLKENQ